MTRPTQRISHDGPGALMLKQRRRLPSRPVEPAEPPPLCYQRVIGLDLGSRRIGIAISDADGGFVAHRHVLERSGLSHDRAALAAILDEYPAAMILVGLPLTMAGAEGSQAVRVRGWACQLLAGRDEVKEFRDERLTTVAAREILKRGAPDAVAAELLVHDYFSEQAKS